MLAGTRIAGYRLEEQIGSGGMAVVFRAVDERLGRRAAVKVLSGGLAADEAFRQRFMRESRTAAAVDDPHTSRCTRPEKRMACFTSPCGMCLAGMSGR